MEPDALNKRPVVSFLGGARRIWRRNSGKGDGPFEEWGCLFYEKLRCGGNMKRSLLRRGPITNKKEMPFENRRRERRRKKLGFCRHRQKYVVSEEEVRTWGKKISSEEMSRSRLGGGKRKARGKILKNVRKEALRKTGGEQKRNEDRALRGLEDKVKRSGRGKKGELHRFVDYRESLGSEDVDFSSDKRGGSQS